MSDELQTVHKKKQPEPGAKEVYNMEYVLKTRDLTKKYGNKVVVNKLNMTIEKGDIYGFIGRNGAGKTTTMKMVLGMCFPNSGMIELFGRPAHNSARGRIGSLIEAPGIYKGYTAYENMKRFSILFGGDDKKINELLDMMELSGTGKKKAGAFSLGMKQRLGIAIAMLGDPEFLVLDEPVNGLDPAGIKGVRDVILRLNKEKGVTFFISSHLLGELAKISTRYGIINDGVLVEEFTAEELMENCRKILTIKCSEPKKADELLKTKLGIEDLSIKEDTITVNSGFDDPASINSALVKAECGVFDFHVSNLEMEDYFIERIGR